MKRISLIIAFSIFILSVIAKEKQDTTVQSPKKVNIVWMPVISSNPVFGWMFGVAPSANWLMGNPDSTKISSCLGSVIYTTKKQILITVKSNVFLKNDSWNLMGDWRFFVTSQPTFGLGTGPQSSKLVSTGIEYKDGMFSKGIEKAQMMKFNYFRFHETALKRIKSTRIFAGVGYHLDFHTKINDQLLDLEADTPVITSHYAYSVSKGIHPDKYVLSGVSLNLVYDTRDNQINPYSGRYAFASFKYNPKWLGSEKYSSTLWLEYRDYFHLSKKRPRNILALWLYSSIELGGVLPYMDLPAIGWDQFGRSGRGYPQGRFRGQALMYGELEWRFPLQRKKEKLGGVLFLNSTTANNKDTDLHLFKYVNPGGGIGFRWMVNEKSRTNLTIDYAFGFYGSGGLYIGVNETF